MAQTPQSRRDDRRFVARFFDGRAEYEGYREEFFSGRIVDICREGDAALGEDASVYDTHRDECAKLYALVRKREPDTVVETGVFHGVSTAAALLALDANDRGTLHSVDPSRATGDGYYAEFVERNRPSCSEAGTHDLGDREFSRALEVGCGYGRLSGWFADRADDHVAVEPNRDAVGQAAALYPDLDFTAGVAADIPFPADSFDLVMSWIVLSHVQPGHVEAAASELVRVLRDDGVLLACEHTSGQPGTAVWPRSLDEYRELFAPLSLTHTGPRGTEPTFEYADRTTSMLFEA